MSSDYRLVVMENGDFVIQELDRSYGPLYPSVWREKIRHHQEMQARRELEKFRKKEAEDLINLQRELKGRTVKQVLDEG